MVVRWRIQTNRIYASFTAMYLNRITLIGYLARDAERRIVDGENPHVIPMAGSAWIIFV